MNWQRIESAPKDGTPILLYSPDASSPCIFIGRYLDFEENGKGDWYDYWRQDGAWAIDVEVTHWMLLPDVPKV